MNPRGVAWCALLVAALLLRAWGLDFGSPPTLNHVDEFNYGGIAGQLDWDDLNPHFFDNPPLMTYVLFAARQVRTLVVGTEADREWIDDGGLIRLARWTSVLSGVATVALVGAAAMLLLGSAGAALAAGAVVAFSFLHGRDSHYGVNDAPLVALIAFALYAASRAHVQGGRRWLWWSALAAGLATSMKYNGAAAIALPLTVLALRKGTIASRLGEAGCLLLVAAAACFATNPWPILDPAGFAAGFDHQVKQWAGRRVVGQQHEPVWWLYAEASLAMLGVAHAVAAVAGLVLLARREPRVTLILLATPALYLVVMLDQTLFFWRYALPLLPFAAVAAGAAWGALARRLAPVRTPTVLALLVGAASLQPAVLLLRHDWLATQPHTWLLARDWILEHVPPGQKLYLAGYAPRLPPGRYGYLFPEARSAANRELQQGGWVVTDSFFESSWRNEVNSERSTRFFERLHDAFEPVAEFAPGPDGDPPFVVDAVYSPLTDMWSIDRPGYTIRVYRLEPEDWQRLLAP